MRVHRIAVGLFMFALAAPGCAGDEGPAGPAGADGPAGPGFDNEFTGVVVTSQGPAAEVPVILNVVDRDGQRATPIGAALTDGDGVFAIHVADFDVPTAALLLEALSEDGDLQAFVAQQDQTVDAVTTAVSRTVSLIAESPRGRSVLDFDPGELVELYGAAEQAVSSAGTDRADLDEVFDRVLVDVGEQIADSSGGVVVPSVSRTPQVGTPPDALAAIDAFPLLLVGSDDARWDIEGRGSIGDGGGNDAYDSMFGLQVAGTAFPFLSPGATTQVQDGREAFLGPLADLGGSGLDVSRKVFVPTNDSFARFTEILSNPTASPIGAAVRVFGNLGSDDTNNLVNFSSSGDDVVDAEDFWLVNHQEASDPPLAFLFPGAAPSKTNDNIQYIWDVTVPAGETITVVHWAFQLPGGTAEDLRDRMLTLEPFPVDTAFFDGLTQDEVEASAVSFIAPNVRGEAGSVAPFAILTVENLTQGGSAAVDANSDGSFRTTVPAVSGDQIRITSLTGRDETVTVP